MKQELRLSNARPGGLITRTWRVARIYDLFLVVGTDDYSAEPGCPAGGGVAVVSAGTVAC